MFSWIKSLIFFEQILSHFLFFNKTISSQVNSKYQCPGKKKIIRMKSEFIAKQSPSESKFMKQNQIPADFRGHTLGIHRHTHTHNNWLTNCISREAWLHGKLHLSWWMSSLRVVEAGWGAVERGRGFSQTLLKWCIAGHVSPPGRGGWEGCLAQIPVPKTQRDTCST